VGSTIPNAEGRPCPRAVAWLLLLAVVFFATYNFANAMAARRHEVGSIVFEWERAVPLLPWTIVPYWLIDLLYGLSLLLCRTRRELDTHAFRLLAVQAIAVSCFLLFPLRFSFERPAVEGVFGPMFDALMAFDQPFNQAPSLHIALLVVLAALYLRVLPRRWHPLVHGVSLLIGVSVLTTWQHHFIDIPTGLWLGCLCLWMLPQDRRSPLAGARWTGSPLRRRLSARYALAAIACAMLAVLPFEAGGGGAGIGGIGSQGFDGGGAWLWLGWPAGALALVAAVYAFLDARAFGKQPDGTMDAASKLLFGPYIASAWINARLWTRRIEPASRIVPGLLLGRMPTRSDLGTWRAAALVDLSAELPSPRAEVPCQVVPMLDLLPPAVDQIEAASVAIAQAMAMTTTTAAAAGDTVGVGDQDGPQGPQRTVLVCCALGFSRSALAVAAWLIRSGHAPSIEDAVRHIRTARPAVVLGDAQLDALRSWMRQRAVGGDGHAAPVEAGR